MIFQVTLVCCLKDTLLIEETDRGLLIRSKEENKLSWGETYQTMASEKENWDDFDTTLFDGLEDDDFECQTDMYGK